MFSLMISFMFTAYKSVNSLYTHVFTYNKCALQHNIMFYGALQILCNISYVMLSGYLYDSLASIYLGAKMA